MLKTLVIIGCSAIISLIPLIVTTFIQINKFSDSLKKNHPDIERMSLFKISSTPSLSIETRNIGQKAKLWFLVSLAAFSVFVLSGFLIGILIPN